MKCLLCDINPAMREAWEKELERRPRLAALCSVVAGGITDLRVDAVVSPANSFGVFGGGGFVFNPPHRRGGGGGGGGCFFFRGGCARPRGGGRG